MSWFGRLLAACAVVVLAACGGGGAGSTDSGPDPAVTISGFVMKGPVAGAVVRLQAVSSDGTRVDLATTTTAADGSFEFRVVPPIDAAVLLTARGGAYSDEATGNSTELSVPLRALDIWTGSPRRMSLTPFSEVGVRLVERSAPADWSAPAVRAANSRVDAWLGLTHYLDFRPVDLIAGASSETATELDVAMSLSVGAISTFAKRLDANSSTSLTTALDGLYHLAFVDPLDDRLGPAYLGALADFVDLMALPADTKRSVKTLLLTGENSTPLTDVVLQQFMPRGVSSGLASAAMADDALELLGHPGGRTAFNKRGALVAYTTAADTPDWQVAYTASVAEMFGDGDVGIGRWNGGAIISTRRMGDEFVPSAMVLPYDALHYAVARPATGAPACGLRRLSLAASTQPTVQTITTDHPLRISGLAPDSMLSMQYMGDTLVGADIGLRLLDGSVVRFRTLGGLNSPWVNFLTATGGEGILEPSGPLGALENHSLSISVLAAGNGARKAVVRVLLRDPYEPTEMTAVFIAPDAAPEAAGCGTAGTAGPGIVPRPSDGEQLVFGEFNGNEFYRGAPILATFGSKGQLESTNGSRAYSLPIFDLAGNASASIGRVMATGDIGGQPVTRSMPYAVVQPGATVPASGTVIYDLVYASAVIAARGGSGAQAPEGLVGAATLEIVYGEYPVGTPSPYYSTVRLSVAGSLDGLPFVLAGSPSSEPAEGRANGPQFSGPNFAGSVGAPNGEFAALWYRASVFSVPIDGSLLFRRRP